MSDSIKIGISHGDINGIGYEVILKTLADTRISELCTPIIYGSPKVVAYHRKALNLPEYNINRARNVEECLVRKPNIINCLGEDIHVELGKSSAHAGECAVIALEKAVDDLKNNKIDALITAPINKQNIQSEKFNYPGHTEYLKNVLGANEVLMLMVNDLMRIGVVAGHVPISKVSETITVETLLKKLKILNISLQRDFGIRKPKIAVFGLNPHSGDHGVIGNEEQNIIIPALEKANAEGILAMGPFAADGFFSSEGYKKFDGILAMYHDQGLTPFKALDMDSGVNFTAGMNFIRTSPAHGTAYDIAGTNTANPDSFRHALYLAIDVYKNRLNHKEFTKEPLKNVDLSSFHNGADNPADMGQRYR